MNLTLEDMITMGDFKSAMDELEREPTEEEMRADRAANVREYFRAKKDGEDFRPVAEERRRTKESTFTAKISTDELEMFKEFTSTLEEKSTVVEEAIDMISSTIGYLLPKDAFDW
jgi:hypothetical protein